jgi:Fe-S cluster assembly iron-binding protein IscA
MTDFTFLRRQLFCMTTTPFRMLALVRRRRSPDRKAVLRRAACRSGRAAARYRVQIRTRSEEDEFMLLLTHDAAAEIAEARRAQGVPETFGVRLFGAPQSEGGMEVGLTFAQVPAEDDEVTEQEGTRVFVAPEVAGPLAAAALDVEQTPEGAKLVLTRQEPGGDD